MAEHVVVSGGTGFVGRALVPRLAERGEVIVLTRGGGLPEPLAALAGVRAVSWDAEGPGDWEASISGARAVVHLAGSQAVGVRFTAAAKRRILESRVTSAQALVGAIERASPRPPVLVSASGVGFYGGRLTDEPCDEETPPGDDFLALVCVAWEGAANAARALGVRVVTARLGVVIGKGGGPLPTMALPFKLFAGGPLGTGRQIVSWISLDDAVSAFLRAVFDPALSGPVNLASPNAVPQAELARALGRALHRPSWLPAPGFALELVFGEGALPILTGQRAVPTKLQKLGFRFRRPVLDAALEDALEPG